MRFWIVDNQRVVDVIIKAIASGRCKSEKKVESLARMYGCSVTWVDGFDADGNRI